MPTLSPGTNLCCPNLVRNAVVVRRGHPIAEIREPILEIEERSRTLDETNAIVEMLNRFVGGRPARLLCAGPKTRASMEQPPPATEPNQGEHRSIRIRVP